MNNIFKFIIFIVLQSLIASNSFSELVPVKDFDRRYKYLHITYTANDDYTYETTTKWAIEVLDKRAIEDLKEITIGHSTSIESVEILEAYNQKPDGTQVETPKDNYQVKTNKGRDNDGPVFSDRSSITTVLPEVEVGDTLVFSYKRVTRESMFPGYYTASNSFSRRTAYDEIIINLIVPEDFPGLHQTRELTEKITKKDGKVHYQWTWSNKEPMRDLRENYSVWDLETRPGFSYSTFNSYKDISRAYGVRALPKVVISDRVKKLADEIVGDANDPKEQARLLYEWVATKITYAGNCVGVGAVVPHDISFILDNHMGDCKDHATLLEAFLTYKGIKSEQALINSGSVYKLPTIPAVNSVNHVINYLPDFDLFVDSTSTSTPFGRLPFSIQGKPVLMVENFVEGLKTPSDAPGTNAQNLTANMKVGRDGSISGTVSIELDGSPAVSARSGWRNVSKDSEEQWLKDIFTRNGHIGSATMEKDDPQPLIDSFDYSMTFESKEFVLTDSAGAFSIYSPVPAYFSVDELVSVPERIEEHPVVCTSGKATEKYIYEFPEDFEILYHPKDIQIEGPDLHYEATYKLDKNVLTVNRKLEDKTLGPTCVPEYMTAQKEVMQKINKSLRHQVLYKPLNEL